MRGGRTWPRGGCKGPEAWHESLLSGLVKTIRRTMKVALSVPKKEKGEKDAERLRVTGMVIECVSPSHDKKEVFFALYRYMYPRRR